MDDIKFAGKETSFVEHKSEDCTVPMSVSFEASNAEM